MKSFPFEAGHPVYAAGTIIMIRVFGGIKHYGICTGYGTVIHTSRRFGRVEESDFETFCHGRRAVVLPHSSHVDGSTLVARARSRKGQRYNVLNNNCEHFVTWVVEGKGRSAQLGPVDARRLSKD